MLPTKLSPRISLAFPWLLPAPHLCELLDTQTFLMRSLSFLHLPTIHLLSLLLTSYRIILLLHNIIIILSPTMDPPSKFQQNVIGGKCFVIWRLGWKLPVVHWSQLPKEKWHGIQVVPRTEPPPKKSVCKGTEGLCTADRNVILECL